MQASGPHKLDIAVSKPHGADMEAPGSYEEAQSAALTHPVPVFSTPYVDDIQGCVVVAHVDGYVRCLRLGDGSQVRVSIWIALHGCICLTGRRWVGPRDTTQAHTA